MPKFVEAEHAECQESEMTETKSGIKRIKQQLQNRQSVLKDRVCNSGIYCEDSYWVGKRKSTPHYIGNAICHFREDFPIDPCFLYQYIDAVEGFSRREFSIARDALWAFSGVANSFETLLPHVYDEGFIWGLPIQKIDAALLWFPVWGRGGMRSGLHSFMVDDNTIRLPFPTWSWVSWGGQLEYDVKCERDARSLVEWQKDRCYAINPAAPLSAPWYLFVQEEVLQATQDNISIWPHFYLLMLESSLGFLRFKAQSAYFEVVETDLEMQEEGSSKKKAYSDQRFWSR
jgi:hypothetical protein